MKTLNFTLAHEPHRPSAKKKEYLPLPMAPTTKLQISTFFSRHCGNLNFSLAVYDDVTKFAKYKQTRYLNP